jgi:hypothetical protein
VKQIRPLNRQIDGKGQKPPGRLAHCEEKLVMTPHSKFLAVLAIAGTMFAGSAVAEDPAGGDHRMGSGMMRGMTEMRESMTRMMDGCARMMQTPRQAPDENQGSPAPEEDKRQ